MGAVISLRLAVENKAVEFSERISRVSARISKKVGASRESRRSRMSEGSNAWSEASETAAGPSAGTGADGAGTSGADGSSSVVGVESRSVDVEIARPGSKRASRDPDLRPMRQAYHGTVRQVLTSKFVLMQASRARDDHRVQRAALARHPHAHLRCAASARRVTQCLFNMLSSVACSVALFYLLFVVAVVPPGDRMQRRPPMPRTHSAPAARVRNAYACSPPSFNAWRASPWATGLAIAAAAASCAPRQQQQ